MPEEIDKIDADRVEPQSEFLTDVIFQQAFDLMGGDKLSGEAKERYQQFILQLIIAFAQKDLRLIINIMKAGGKFRKLREQYPEELETLVQACKVNGEFSAGKCQRSLENAVNRYLSHFGGGHGFFKGSTKNAHSS